MLKKILVTGAGGYIGTLLVPLLLKKKYKVVALDRFYFGLDYFNNFKKNKNLEIIKKDIRQLSKKDFFNIDTVIDLAALSNDPSCELDINLTKDINYFGRLNCAKMAKMAGVKKYIFSSTCSVYGDTKSQILSETSATKPISEYAKSSLKVEHELLNDLSDKNFFISIVRNGTLFGLSPRMRYDLVVNLMTLSVYEERKIYVTGGGEQYRPLIHVRDVCEFFLEMLKNEYKDEIFNLSLQNIKIIDLAHVIKNYFKNINVQIITTSDDQDKRNYNVDNKKMFKKSKFKPKNTIENGVKEIFDNLMLGKSKKTIKTSTLNWYKHLIDSKKTLDEILIDGKLF
jgi:nucleoside-diphosphate-sugar epimerase